MFWYYFTSKLIFAIIFSYIMEDSGLIFTITVNVINQMLPNNAVSQLQMNPNEINPIPVITAVLDSQKLELLMYRETRLITRVIPYYYCLRFAACKIAIFVDSVINTRYIYQSILNLIMKCPLAYYKFFFYHYNVIKCYLLGL